jgi:hypothetical protein
MNRALPLTMLIGGDRRENYNKVKGKKRMVA